MIEKLRINITRIFTITMVCVFLVSESRWEEKASLMAPLLFFTGVLLVAVASLGRIWCSLYIAGYKTDTLVILGPYSFSRNPLYFFSFLGAAGVGFATKSLIIPSAIALAFAVYYPLVIRREERMLQEIHGAAFLAYCEQVPRFFPALTLLKEPEEYTVKPVVFRKHTADALWFFVLVGVIEIIGALHRSKIMPVIFTLY